MNTNTSALFTRAVDAIRDDMAQHSKDAAIQLVGAVMTELLRHKPEIADKIVPEGKNLKKAMEAMKAEAGKHRNGSWACLDALSGMKKVLKYYEIDGIADRELIFVISESMGAPGGFSAEQVEREARAAAPISASVDAGDDLDIDALLKEIGGEV